MDITGQAERANSPFLWLVLSIIQWIEWCPAPLPIGADNLLYSVYVFNADLFQRYHHRSHTNNVLPAYRHPLAWSSWHIKLTWQFLYIVMKRIRQLFVFNYHKWHEGERGTESVASRQISPIWGSGSGTASPWRWYELKRRQIIKLETIFNMQGSWIVEIGRSAQGRWNSICEGLKQKDRKHWNHFFESGWIFMIEILNLRATVQVTMLYQCQFSGFDKNSIIMEDVTIREITGVFCTIFSAYYDSKMIFFFLNDLWISVWNWDFMFMGIKKTIHMLCHSCLSIVFFWHVDGYIALIYVVVLLQICQLSFRIWWQFSWKQTAIRILGRERWESAIYFSSKVNTQLWNIW